MRMKKKNCGTTLVELLVVLAIAAIVLSMSAPSFHSLIASMRLKAVSELMVAHLHFARSEAIKRNARVVLCKSTDGKQCVSMGGWEQGWIVFHDANDNAQVDSQETILLQLLRPDLILTQGLKLFEAEFGAASRSDFGGAHAGQIVGRA